MPDDKLPPSVRERYEVHEFRHALAILAQDFPQELADIVAVLDEFRLCRTWIDEGGGGLSKISQKLDGGLFARGWKRKTFDTSISIDGDQRPSPTHEVDCFKNRVALEIEWNNKDPFYDRDLNNFRLLFDLHAISVGVIITRADDLQALFKARGAGQKFGASTTHMKKLLPRIRGGGGAGCPLLIFGITQKLYDTSC